MQNSAEARTSTGHVVWGRLLIGLIVALVFAASISVGAGEAKAAPAQPVTRVFLDGDYKDRIVGDGVLRFTVYKGCHEIDAIQRKSGEVTRTTSAQFCKDGPTRVKIRVDDGNIGIQLASRS